MYKSLTVVPAYGRDYKSKKEVAESWNNNQDWFIEDFRLTGYVGKGGQARLITDGVTHLHFRYKQQRNIVVLDLTSNKWS